MNIALLERTAPLHEEKRDLPEEPSVLQALDGLGLSPFKPESVARYKRKIDRHYAWKSLPARCAGLLIFTGVVSAFLFALSSLSLAISVISSEAPSRGGAWPVLVTFCLGLVSLVTGIRCTMAKTYTPIWERYRHYRIWDAGTPEFVQHTGDEITGQVPGAEVYVEKLTVNEQVVDPFLVIVHGDEEYYVEVWDEPGFDKKRQV